MVLVLPEKKGNKYYWRVRADTTTTGDYGEGTFHALEDDIIYVYCPADVEECLDYNKYNDPDFVYPIGHKSVPFRTIAGGITEAVRLGKREVRIAGRGSGTYPAYFETIIIKDGVSLTGGYDPNFNDRDIGTYPVIIQADTSYVAYAGSVTRATIIDGMKFENISTGLSANYGVNIDSSTSDLMFNNVYIDGGAGANACGMSISNFSEPVITQSTITTGVTSVKSVGIYINLSSKATLNYVSISTGTSAQTAGIVIGPESNSGVSMTNSSIITGTATDYSVGIGAINSSGGEVNVSKSQITIGDVSLGDAYGINAENGSVTNNIISIGVTGISYNIVNICYQFAPVAVVIEQNVLSILSAETGNGIHVCNNFPKDSIIIENNTILITGMYSAGINVPRNVVSNSLLNINENMVYEIGTTAFDTGIYTPANYINSVNDNIIWNMDNYAGYSGNLYCEICAGTGIKSSTGTFGNNKTINRTTADGLGNNNLKGVFASGSNVYAATWGGLSISTDGGVSFINKTTSDGLGSNIVKAAFASGQNIYAATESGLSISTDDGLSFINKTTSDGLGNDFIRGVFASGTNIYAATAGGLSISTDGGVSFINKTTSDGLGSNSISGVFVSGTNIYASTSGGLSISTNGGVSFINKTTSDGLGANILNGVFASGTNIYAATNGGLSISTDGGVSFINKTTADGLGDNLVHGVFASGSNIYAATESGLSVSNNDGVNFTNKTIFNGLGDNLVLGVFASGSTVYAATPDGLSISDDGVLIFSNKTTGNGLGSNIVKAAFASGQNIYAATSSGLSISNDGGTTFDNKTTSDGLGSDSIWGVFASGSTVYAATNGGLSISTDGGVSFINKTTADGLGDNGINGVFASGSTVYAATNGSGLSISADGGESFINKTMADGLGNDLLYGVFVSGSNIYAATDYGLSISTDGGVSFINKTTADGLGHNIVYGVYGVFVSNSKIYAATEGGLSISTDGGVNFINKTTADGLGSNWVIGVFASGSNIYAATESGLSISTNGGVNFSNKTTADGLPWNLVWGVFASGSIIYAATWNGGLSISSYNNNCTNLLTSYTTGSPILPTGNRTIDYSLGSGVSQVFVPTYDPLVPSTWEILAGGPADLDFATNPGWSEGDIGADAPNVGIPDGVTPGADW
jgi:hypothetical protein